MPSPKDYNAMTLDEFKTACAVRLPRYQRLADNIVPAIRTFFEQQEISILDITSRIKTVESAYEKISRKNYADPFIEIEDLCGIRVICYYPSDVDKIARIVRSEFDVKTEEDTRQRLSPQEFGYRSTHFIVTIKTSWLKAPNYRELGGLKIEIQVRTILMHAWAEIEHKLAYKSESQVPEAFKRKLYRLSAKFEEADEQFEELRRGLLDYRETIRGDAKSELSLLRSKELNLDTFQILLDTAYPDLERADAPTAKLLVELAQYELSMSDLVDAVDAQRPLLKQLDEMGKDRQGHRWAQVGAMRNALDLSNDKYYQVRRKELKSIPVWMERVSFGRKALGKRVAAT